MAKGWTTKEEMIVRHFYPRCTAKEIARRLGRTENAIEYRVSKLGLKKYSWHRWTPEDYETVRKMHPDIKGISEQIGVSIGVVYVVANKMGLYVRGKNNGKKQKTEKTA